VRSLAVIALVVLAAGVAWAGPDDLAAIQDWPNAWRAKIGYADLGDFDDGVSLAVEFDTPEWLFTVGWDDAGGTLTDPATALNYAFDGSYWFAEITYTYRPDRNPLIYIGAGPGWYRMDGDFRQIGAVPAVTASSDDGCIGGHVQVGFESEDRRLFGEVEWVFSTEHWSWDSDGLRVFFGYRF